jgi:hypothetical protein
MGGDCPLVHAGGVAFVTRVYFIATRFRVPMTLGGGLYDLPFEKPLTSLMALHSGNKNRFSVAILDGQRENYF